MCGPRALEERLGGKNAEASKARDSATCGSVRCMGAMMRMCVQLLLALLMALLLVLVL